MCIQIFDASRGQHLDASRTCNSIAFVRSTAKIEIEHYACAQSKKKHRFVAERKQDVFENRFDDISNIGFRNPPIRLLITTHPDSRSANGPVCHFFAFDKHTRDSQVFVSVGQVELRNSAQQITRLIFTNTRRADYADRKWIFFISM